MTDLFHSILYFLYEKPLDGSFHDLRECLNGKINKKDGERASFQQLQKVINFLIENEYISFEQRQAINEKTKEFYDVKVKYGEDPTKYSSEEANFETTYPMGTLTLKGFNYIFDREKEKAKHKILKYTFIVAVTGCFISMLSFGISILNYLHNSNQNKLKQDLIIKDSLLIGEIRQNQKIYSEKTVLQFKLDSTIKSNKLQNIAK